TVSARSLGWRGARRAECNMRGRAPNSNEHAPAGVPRSGRSRRTSARARTAPGPVRQISRPPRKPGSTALEAAQQRVELLGRLLPRLARAGQLEENVPARSLGDGAEKREARLRRLRPAWHSRAVRAFGGNAGHEDAVHLLHPARRSWGSRLGRELPVP